MRSDSADDLLKELGGELLVHPQQVPLPIALIGHSEGSDSGLREADFISSKKDVLLK